MSRKVKNVNPLLLKIFQENDFPRDRKGTFEPQVVPKYPHEISDIEEKIISMCGCGISTTDINDHF